MIRRTKTGSVKGHDSGPELLPQSYHSALRDVRNYLAGRVVGSTRDRSLMEEVFRCLFAKHQLAKAPRPTTTRGGLVGAYQEALEEVKCIVPGIFEADERIGLDEMALAFVDAQLESMGFEESRADVFSEVYEVFGGSGVKASEGQFFTPTVAVDLLVDLVRPPIGARVCDPAAGAGGFLGAVARNWTAQGAAPEIVLAGLHGVEKDDYLARLTRGRLALLLDGVPRIVCGDSLAGVDHNGQAFDQGLFDVILTNPPFGARIVAGDERTLARYTLARRFSRTAKGGGQFRPGAEIDHNTPPQILFLEHCLDKLVPGGILGAVLPESLVSSKSYAHIVAHLKERADLVAVVGMPEALFKTSGKSGTHTKTVALVARRKDGEKGDGTRRHVFFAEAKWCGHDSRARRVPLNDVPVIRAHFAEFQRGEPCGHGHLGTAVPVEAVGLSLAPRAFEFDAVAEAERMAATYELALFRDLVDAGLLAVSTGDEVGKLAYGTGDIPFVRTSDISGWEIKVDPKHRVSKAVHERYAFTQDVRAGDVLMVRDGTYLIGTCAILSEADLPMLYQSHIYKIRALDPSRLNPYLLLASLSSPYVQRQIKSFCVSQDIIDSLGGRLYDLRLPLPKNLGRRQEIATMVERVVRARAEARETARRVVAEFTVC